MIGDWRAHVAPEAHGARPQRDESLNGGEPSLQAARRADAEAGAHVDAQVEAARVDEEALQDVRG